MSGFGLAFRGGDLAMRPEQRAVEWPTLGLIGLTYLGWAVALWILPSVSTVMAIVTLAVLIAFHGSLQHECIHGHPFKSEALNVALIWPPLTLAIPYLRFRDTHLAHHRDAMLTDPYDDPESNYLDPAVWAGLPRLAKMVLRLNNTLAGRMILGPAISQFAFMSSDWAARSLPEVRSGWLWHGPAAAAVLALVWAAPLPVWAYLVAAYAALGLLKIRTFLEHQAHEQVRGRTVIIEDRGPLALLFLNNNLHVVHHMHPRLPWYRLPAAYGRNPKRYGAINDNYVYRSYGQIFRQHFFRAKDPVPHPIWRRP